MMVPGRGSGAEICWVTVVVAAQIHKKRGQTGLRILRAIVMLLLSELRCPWRATAIWRCRPIEKSTQLWRLRSERWQQCFCLPDVESPFQQAGRPATRVHAVAP